MLKSDNIEDRHLKIAIEKITDGVYIVDDKRRILYWSKGAEEITGYTSAEVINSFCFDNILRHIDEQGHHLCKQGCPLHQTILDGQHRENRVYLHHKSGMRVPITVKVAPLYSPGGNVIGAVETFSRNYSEDDLARRIKELEQISLLDELTKIANRNYLEMKLHTIHMELLRYGWSYGVALFGIDNLDGVIKKHGRDTVEKILKMVATIMSQNIRPFDVAGRWSGEEFLVIATNITQSDLHGMSERLRMLTENSAVYIDGAPVKVTLSAGAVIACKDDIPENIEKTASDLLQESRDYGGNRVTSVKL